MKLQNPEIVSTFVSKMCEGMMSPEDEKYLFEYLESHAVVLTREHLSLLIHTIDTVEQEEVRDFLLEFIETLLEFGEDFNIEGVCTESHVNVLLHLFPDKTAINIMRMLVAHSKECAEIVYSFDQRADFVSYLSANSYNLIELIRFLSSFFLYDEFLSFNVRQIFPLMKLVLDHPVLDIKCEALESLICASSSRVLASDVALSDHFLELYNVTESDETTSMRSHLLRNVIHTMPDPTPLLISDDGTIIRFLKGCFSMSNDVILCYSTEICGLIASLGEIFTLKLIENGFDEAILSILNDGGSMALVSCASVAACRFLIHCGAQRRFLYLSQHFIELISDIVESLSIPDLRDFLASLIHTSRVCEATSDTSILTLTRNPDFLVALQNLAPQNDDRETAAALSFFLDNSQ